MSLFDKLFGKRDPPRAGVSFDTEKVVHTLADGSVETVRWDGLKEVGILTTDEGPLLDDVIWMLLGDDGGGCAVPSETEGMQELLPRLQQLPGFDNEAVIAAMSSVENAKFVCWRRSPAE